MIFKTVTLQIYRPSRIKRELLDTAMTNYTKALNWLLAQYKDEIMRFAESKKSVNSTELLKLPEKSALKQLNDFNVQPFKDSIKKEFASIASAYIAQVRRGNAGYPVITISNEEFEEKIRCLIENYTFGNISNKQFIKAENALISRLNRLHMIYFGRYSQNRDYCLLYDQNKQHYFVKVYLLNQSNKLKITKKNESSADLRYIAPGLPAVEPAKSYARYIILPLAFGKSQKKQLERALIKPSILHTARIVKKDNKYYLLLNIESEQKQKIKAETTMGIARSANGLHYTIPGKTSGTIEARSSENLNLYSISAKILRYAVEYSSQVILEAGGGKSDRVMQSKRLAPFSVTDYSRLSAILAYKLPEAGLPTPIEVSANGLYDTCPRCGCKTRKNRIDDEIFACIDCGYAAPIEDIGSLGLALRLNKYKKDRIPIYVEKREGSVRYYNHNLNFEIYLSESNSDLSELYYELALLARSTEHFFVNPKNFSLLKKLRDAENISDVIRFVDKTPC